VFFLLFALLLSRRPPSFVLWPMVRHRRDIALFFAVLYSASVDVFFFEHPSSFRGLLLAMGMNLGVCFNFFFFSLFRTTEIQGIDDLHGLSCAASTLSSSRLDDVRILAIFFDSPCKPSGNFPWELDTFFPLLCSIVGRNLFLRFFRYLIGNHSAVFFLDPPAPPLAFRPAPRAYFEKSHRAPPAIVLRSFGRTQEAHPVLGPPLFLFPSLFARCPPRFALDFTIFFRFSTILVFSFPPGALHHGWLT